MNATTLATLPRLYEKETAVAIRKLLRASFPGTKFSVTLGRGSMVSSVHVDWTEGPTRAEVGEIVNQFEAGHFDGMTDSYEYDRSRTVTVDNVAYRPCTQYVQARRHKEDR